MPAALHLEMDSALRRFLLVLPAIEMRAQSDTLISWLK